MKLFKKSKKNNYIDGVDVLHALQKTYYNMQRLANGPLDDNSRLIINCQLVTLEELIQHLQEYQIK